MLQGLRVAQTAPRAAATRLAEAEERAESFGDKDGPVLQWQRDVVEIPDFAIICFRAQGNRYIEL